MEKYGPFPPISVIIPKLIGVIVGKNPDLVTVSNNKGTLCSYLSELNLLISCSMSAG
jgi:hypothetical protein